MEEIFEIRSCTEILANDIKVVTTDQYMLIIILVTADWARDSRHDSLIRLSTATLSAVFVLGSRSRLNLEFVESIVLAPDSFTTGVDWLLERTAGTGMNGVSFGLHSFSDLDFADDVTLYLPSYLNTSYLHLRWWQGHISWAPAELAEHKSLSFGQQGGWTINNHSSRTGGCNGWRVCLFWLPCPLNNSTTTKTPSFYVDEDYPARPEIE